MKIESINNAGSITDFVKFESKEELRIFSRFIFDNDYFIRKCYKTVYNYENYISSCPDLYLDCDYHKRLANELTSTIDNYKRKNKLIRLNELLQPGQN